MANGLGTITSVTISPSPYWNPDNDKQFTIRWTASNASDNEITGYFLFLRACLKSSNEDGDESKSKHLGRNKEFALTIFPKSAELVEPAK